MEIAFFCAAGAGGDGVRLTAGAELPLPMAMPDASRRSHSTRQRAAIFAALDGARGPLSAEEIWEIARKKKPGLGLRTVFRNLQEQVAEQSLLRVVFPGHPPRYEKPSPRHHPHFVCFDCGSVFDLPGETPDVRPLCRLPEGFEAAGAEVTLFGRCAECARAKGG